MDLATQSSILELAGAQEGETNIVILLGAPDAESAELSALTVTSGDPTFAGPLAGVQLGLPVYHVLEEAIASAANAEAYEQHIGIMGDVLDADQIRDAMVRVRNDES